MTVDNMETDVLYSIDIKDTSSYNFKVKIASLAERKAILCLAGKHSYLVLFLVLVITAFVFSFSLKLDWTNWDDNLLVYENPLVIDGRFKDIFTSPAEYNTFNPLAVSTFALEWKLVKDSPYLYHFNNLVLHLVCTVLIWCLFRKLGLSVWWSGFGTLLFGIHPMRVESVAWIAERKDGLFGLFYLAALLAYIRYIYSDKMSYLSLTFIFFLLSLLSKGQAVAMPFTLILLDWYFKRQIDMKVILEKAIFLVAALIMALLTLTFFVKNVYSAADKRTIINVFNLFEQTVLAGYAYTIYIVKSVFPYAVSPLYPMPDSLHPQHWLGAVLAVCIFSVSLLMWRKRKYITFGLLFYTFNIFFLLMPFWMSETAFLFDHYSYFAHIGLFFTIAMIMQHLSDRLKDYRISTTFIASGLLVAYAILTIQYIPVWQNSETLWTYVIKKYPGRLAAAHLNRGNYWYKNKQPEKALEDYSAAIKINPEYPSAYVNRSVIYLENNDMEQALQDYNRSMELLFPPDRRGNGLNSSLASAFSHRSSIYDRMGQYKNALADIHKAIERDPFNPDHYIKRALIYTQLCDYEKAIADFNVCILSDSPNADIINARGVCYLRSGDLKSALNDFNKAILLDRSNPLYYVNRSITYRKLGQSAEAEQDLEMSKKMEATGVSDLKHN